MNRECSADIVNQIGKIIYKVDRTRTGQNILLTGLQSFHQFPQNTTQEIIVGNRFEIPAHHNV